MPLRISGPKRTGKFGVTLAAWLKLSFWIGTVRGDAGRSDLKARVVTDVPEHGLGTQWPGCGTGSLPTVTVRPVQWLTGMTHWQAQAPPGAAAASSSSAAVWTRQPVR